jgi:hypothetical protein
MESPIPRRLSTSISIPVSGNRVHDIESVINSYEAEEERIVNVLSRKLEQVRQPHAVIPPWRLKAFSFETKKSISKTFLKPNLNPMSTN